MVFVNLPEAGSTEEDNAAVRDILSVELGITPTVERTERLGTAGQGRCRLLKVVVETLAAKKQILAKASMLRNTRNERYRRVFIRPDLTKNQLEEQKNLRAELARRRQSQPLRNWCIRQGGVHERDPQT